MFCSLNILIIIDLVIFSTKQNNIDPNSNVFKLDINIIDYIYICYIFIYLYIN